MTPDSLVLGMQISLMRAELLSRYGRADGCSKAQVDLTFQKMKIREDLRPFIYCAFLEKEALTVAKKAANLDWDAIQKGARKSLGTKTIVDGSPFYESGIGQ